MTVEIFTFCDFSQDNGGKLSIVGSFDTIRAPAYPITLPYISLAAKIRFSLQERGRHRFAFTFTDLDGAEYFRPLTGECALEDFRTSTSALVLSMNMVNIEFPRETIVSARLDVDGKEVFHSPLHVVRIQQG